MEAITVVDGHAVGPSRNFSYCGVRNNALTDAGICERSVSGCAR